MGKNRVVVSQPYNDVWAYEHHWQVGLSDCCSDCGTCCFAMFCPYCFMGKMYKRTGECCCMFCVPGHLMALRAKLRTGFRIKGSLCRDFVATTYCGICAAIQMYKELEMQEL